MKTRSTMSEILSRINLNKKKLDSMVQNNALYKNIRGGVGLQPGEMRLVTVKKPSETLIEPGGKTEEETTKKMASSYTSLTAVMDNLSKLTMIKNGVNSTTTITIAGKEMTIAEALSYNNPSVKEYHRIILNKMKEDYADALRVIQEYNMQVFSDATVNKYLEVVLGTGDLEGAKTKDPAKVEEHLKAYRAQKELVLFDPLNIADEIEKKEKFIVDFYHDIGFLLSSINSQLIVEYDLDDEVPIWTIVNADDIKTIASYLNSTEETL